MNGVLGGLGIFRQTAQNALGGYDKGQPGTEFYLNCSWQYSRYDNCSVIHFQTIVLTMNSTQFNVCGNILLYYNGNT